MSDGESQGAVSSEDGSWTVPRTPDESSWAYAELLCSAEQFVMATDSEYEQPLAEDTSEGRIRLLSLSSIGGVQSRGVSS